VIGAQWREIESANKTDAIVFRIRIVTLRASGPFKNVTNALAASERAFPLHETAKPFDWTKTKVHQKRPNVRFADQ
jgi:hypothetical protein